MEDKQMIEKTTGYKVGEQFFPTIVEAQRAELSMLFQEYTKIPMDANTSITHPTILGAIIQNADRIVDILTMTPASKPRARRINGGTKKRTPKPATQTTPAAN